MPDDTTGTAAQPTSDGTAQNTGADNQPGNTDTQAAQSTEATTQQSQQQQTEKTFTQAEVDRIVQNRLKSAVKAELKKLTGETEGQQTVEELQRQLNEQTQKVRSFEARQTIHDHLSDGRNKLNIKPENVRGIEELVLMRLEYDDQGKPANLKEAVDAARSIAPSLFANTPQPIDAGTGRNGAVVGTDMNSFIRRQAGFGN